MSDSRTVRIVIDVVGENMSPKEAARVALNELLIRQHRGASIDFEVIDGNGYEYDFSL